ncbi:ribbon-helix-helix domain-containing protein [Rhizobium sp. AAP116]|uniref:ribbon-helix-helix domain-containing protein n=1 Tax=Rhizobium sp. AAP116 TaxID=1523429 RepID=UPI0006B9E499|nr:ribbon-helix-helix domain-containing protein [Rhizobium sp. AAP116]KPF51778.1 arylsulfate sulfotransferase [Rhizobium sp. AAP116]
MIRKRSITLHGHRTSFSVEDPFLDELKTIARKRGLSFAALIAEIDESRPLDSNLSSALRLFVLREFKQAVEEAEEKVLERPAEANVQRNPVS